MFVRLNFVKAVVNSINIDVIEKLALGLCAFHAFKTRIASTPRPTVRQFKRNLIIDIHDLVADLLIIRVILTTEDDGFLLVTLDFACLYQLFFLCSDAFQKNRRRLIGRILRYKLATDGEVENFGFSLRNNFGQNFFLFANLVYQGIHFNEFTNYIRLIAHRANRD